MFVPVAMRLFVYSALVLEDPEGLKDLPRPNRFLQDVHGGIDEVFDLTHISAGYQDDATGRKRGANRLRYLHPALCLNVKIAKQGIWLERLKDLERTLRGVAGVDLATVAFEEEAEQKGESRIIIYDQDFQHSRVHPVSLKIDAG